MAQKRCFIISVVCMFQFPFEVFRVNCTPAEVNGNFAVSLKGESNTLLLLKFSSRTVGESMWPDCGWQLLDRRKHPKIKAVVGRIFILHTYQEVELQGVLLEYSAFPVEMCGAEWEYWLSSAAK